MESISAFRLKLVRDHSFEYDPGNDGTANFQNAIKVILDWIGDSDREIMVAVMKDVRSHIMGLYLISVGSINLTIAHPREVFRCAIVAGAASVVVIHNHPSGVAEPSNADRRTANDLSKAGDIIGIRLDDFLTLGEDGFYSCREDRIIVGPKD